MQQRQHDPAGLFDRLQYDQSDTPQGRTVIDQLKQRPVRQPPPVNVPPMEPAPPAASPEPTPEPVGGVFSDMLASALPQQQSLPTEPARPAGGIFSDLLASTPGQQEAPNPAPEPAGGVFSDLIPQQPTAAQPDLSRYMPWDQPDILPELSAVDPRAITAGLIAEESDYEQQLQDRALAEKARFYERRMAGPKTQLPEPKLPERDFDTLVGHYRNGVSYIRPNEYSKILNAIEEGKSTPEQEGQFTQFIEPNLDADQKRELNIARLTRDKYLEKQARLDEFYAEQEPPKSALEWEERRPQIKTTEADDAALTALIKGASFNYLLGPDEDRLNSDNPEDVADERANQLIIRKQAEKYPGSTLWGSLLGTMAPTTALTGALRAGRLAWAGRGLQAGPPTAQTAGILARGGAPATTGGMIGENLLTGAAYDIASRPEGSENMTSLENLQARLDVTGFGAMAGILGDLALGQIAKGADFAKARADAFKDKRTRNQLNTFATQNGFKDFDDMAENVMEIIDTPEGPVMRLKKSVYDGMAERDIPSSNVNEQLRQPADINQYRELMAQQSEQARQLAARPETAHAKEPATVTPAGTTEAGVPPTPPETAPVPPAAGRTDTATAEPLTPQRPAPVRDERLSNPNYQDHLLQYPEYRDYLESALWEAREAQKPVTKKNRVTKLVNDDDTLLTAAMKLGGIDKTTLDDTIVESINAHLSNKPKFNRTMRAGGKGSTLDDMARKLSELGYTKDGREMTANELADAIDQETRGRPYFSDAMEDFSAHYEQGSNIASNNATIPTLEAALRGEPLTPAYRKEMARLLADTEADPNFTQPVDVQYEQAGIRTGEPLPPTGPAYDPDFYDVLDDYHDLIARDTGIDLKNLDADDLADIREMERQLQLKDAESFERELYDIADDSTESIFGGLIYGHPDQTAKTPGGEVPEQLAPRNRQTDLERRTEAAESAGTAEPTTTARPGADISQYRRIISDEREGAAQIPPRKPETTAPTAAEKPPDFDLATHTEADLTTRAREQETAQRAEQRTEQQARTKAAADREVAGFELSVQGSGKHVPASQGDLLGTGRTPPSKPEPKPETADDLIDVSPDDINYNRAYEAYVHSSHSPKRRANYEQEEYVLVMRDLADELGKLATTPEQRTLLKQELAQYKEGYLKRKHDLLDAKARTTSPLVTGGANYNVGRQGKRMDAADRIREDFLTWQEKEKRRIKKALQTPQARKPKPVSSESVTPKKQEVTKETAAEKQYKPITNTPDTSKKDLKGGPYTVSYHNELSNALTTGELSLADFQSAFHTLIDNKDEILTRLNKYKKANLIGMANKIYVYARDVTKADVVNDVWDRLLRRYVLDKEVTALHHDPFAHAGAESSLAAAKAKREKGIIDTVNKLTQQDLEDYAAKFAKRRAELDQMKAEQQARMETPETLDDYELIVKNKGEDALTPAQKAEYERLQAERDWQAREQNVQQANVKEGLKTEQEIIVNPITEGTHGKSGKTIYNVNLETRLGKEKFKEAANMAKSMKGGYWKGNFYFKTMDDAEQFIRWLQGDSIDRSGAKMEQEAAKATSRADKLRNMADRLEKTGTEELNAPRTTNTARQMDMASRSRSKASKQIRFAQTLRNIANGMDDGSVQFLSKLDSQTQLELLESIQRRSIPESMMESDFNGYSMSRTVKDGITLDDYVDHIHYPKARLHRDYLRTLITDMKGKRGYARTRNELETLYSIAARNDKHLIDLNPELTESISAFSKKHGTDPGWQFTDNLADIKRLQKMGITNDAQLRTAIRELDGVKSREGIETSAERKLDDMRMKIKRNARNYNDFFPTPDHVTARVMELADVQPGHKTLEPNAGMGHMAGKLRELAGADHVDMVEISTDLADYLKQMGYTVDRSDFMTLERADTYDRIVMNPPFSKNQDIDHVQHAYTMLKPGGRLTAIVSNMAGIRSDSKNRAFSTWMDNVGAHVEDVEAGAFKSSFNPTGVNTKILVIEKPLVEVEPGKLREHAVNADEYHMADAEQAFQHSNRSAAKAYRDRFVKDVQEAYDAAATKAETPEQIEALNNAIGQYKKDYLAAEKEYFTVRQGVASHHIAGRNKFDSSQAERRGRADDLAHDRMTSRMESARYKVEQAVQDARTPEQQAKDLAGQQQAAKEKARFNHLKDVAGYIGEVADHIRNNRTESARDARKWAMPKAYEAAQRGLNEDRAWTIDTLKKMDEQLSDVGGLLKVAGPRSKMGKLYKELTTEPQQTTAGTLYSSPIFTSRQDLYRGLAGGIYGGGTSEHEVGSDEWWADVALWSAGGAIAGKAASRLGADLKDSDFYKKHILPFNLWATKRRPIDANDFITAADGSLNHGYIPKDAAIVMGTEPGPIRLQKGWDFLAPNEKGELKHRGFGLRHIERDDRLSNLTKHGYATPKEFVSDVLENYEKIYRGTRGTFSLIKTLPSGKYSSGVFVELDKAKDGSFYAVNSGLVSRKNYFKNKELLWDRSADRPGIKPHFSTPPTGRPRRLEAEQSLSKTVAPKKETDNSTFYSNPFFAYQKILGLNPLASQAGGALGAITASGPVDTEDEKWYTRLVMGYLAGSLAGGGLHKVLTGNRFRVKGATVIGEGDSWGGRTLDWLGKQWRKVPGMSTGDPDIMPLKKQQELMKLVIERQAEKAGEYLLKNFTPSQRAKMADLIETRGIVKDGGLLHRQAEELDEFISYTSKKLQELGMLSEDIEPGGYLHRYYEKDLGLGNMLKGLTPKGKTLSGSWSRRRGTQEVFAPEYLSKSVRDTMEQIDTLNNEAQALRKKSGDMLDADTSERLADINKELKQLQSIEFVEYLAPQNGKIHSFFFAKDEVPHIPGMKKPGTGAPATASQLAGMKRAPGDAPLVGKTGSMSKTDRVWTLDGREPAGAAILHRDWTKAEREQWGEINDAAYRMVRGQAEVAHDLSLGHFFKTVHDRFKGTKVSDKETPGWIQVPETRIGKGSRMNRYGALAGKYVTKDVWDAIRHHGRNPLLSLTNNHPAVKTYLNALGKWKAYKTVYNPVSHMNNAISNLQMYYLSDNDRQYIGEAAKALWQKDRNALYREAEAAGLFGQGWTSTLAQSGNAKEIDSLLERLRTQPETDDFTESVNFVMELKRHFIESAASIKDAKGPWKTGAALGKAIGKPLVMPLKKPINAAASAAESAYRLEEDLFKMAVFASERAKGKSGFDAVRESEKFFFNYNDMPDAMKMVRDFPIGSPFISYTYFSIPAIARTIVEKPERVLALMAGLEAFNYTAQAINGELQETGYWDRYTAENELVPSWMQGRTMWGGLNNVSIPFVESYKLSLANANAGGNPFVGQSERPGAWPGMLQAWGPGWEGSNPMIRLLSDITRNEDWRGNPIWKEAAPTSEKVRKAANYIYQNITPSNVLIPGSYHQQKVLEGLANQVRKAEDEGEEPNALVESMVDLANATSNLLGGGQFTGLSRAENEILTRDALLGSLGLKLRPMHIEQFFDSKAWEIRQGIEQQKKYLRGQGRLEYENRITPEQMERYERIAEDRIDDLSEQFKRLENAKNVVNL